MTEKLLHGPDVVPVLQDMRGGATLVEIGEVLRHRNLDTTRIYAKVDERALGTLALPWPGGEG